MNEIKLGSFIAVDSSIVSGTWNDTTRSYFYIINGIALSEYGLSMITNKDLKNHKCKVHLFDYIFKIIDLDKFTCFMLEYGEWIR